VHECVQYAVLESSTRQRFDRHDASRPTAQSAPIAPSFVSLPPPHASAAAQVSAKATGSRAIPDAYQTRSDRPTVE
jgi:hypothetical protein